VNGYCQPVLGGNLLGFQKYLGRNPVTDRTIPSLDLQDRDKHSVVHLYLT
jgi:hypothetical protein